MPAEVLKIVDRIRPHLAGRAPEIQGAVLADLLATWLAGHKGPDGVIDKVREEILQMHIATVRELLAHNLRR